MTRVTEAVFSHGVLRPADDLGLREEQRVRLIIEPLDDRPDSRATAVARLRAGIASMQFYSRGPLPTREDVHDRV
jgi:predicted DNA-binding antitoxin AbrB/MazE fold protein